MERKKVLGFWDLAFFSFCAIFGLEAIATSAAIGPSAISWWLVCIIGYFLPFGFIAAELGSAYPEQGGIYVWIKNALGNKWAARSIWFYWVSLPVWLPAIYIATTDIISNTFSLNISLWQQILIGIVLIWVAVGINLLPLRISKWIPNVGAVSQFFVVVGVVLAATVYFLRNRCFANEITITNVLPNLDAAIVFIPVIMYNLMGCELISAAAGEMKNPQRDVPKALIVSAIVIALLYLVTTFSVLVVIPSDQINVASGILQMFTIALSGHSMKQVISIIFGLIITLAFFSGIVTWNLSQNRTVAETANNGELPKILGKMNKNMAPIGASIISGIISTAVIIIYGFIAENAAELFWQVISISLVIGLFSYLMLFPSFIILRIKDKTVKRPYRVPGPEWFAVFLAVMAEVFVLTAVLVLIIQPGHDFNKFSLPVIIGVLIVIILGEILSGRFSKKNISI
jgi:amino acid transporter